jgi:triosephosphate isomerase
MIIAGNFKTFKTRSETENYLRELNFQLSNISNEVKNNSEFIIFPPLTAIDNFESIEKKNNLSVGVQNAYPTKNGAFTGEIGLEQLNEFNIQTILIGHSERRNILKESDKFVAEKFDFFANEDFKIVFCVGEPLEIREQARKNGFQVIEKFLLNQFENIQINYKNFVIAYEPIWAIGTGLTPTLEEIEETLSFLKNRFSREVLYGGSVKLENIEEISNLKSCDGALIGGASLKADNFAEMIKISLKN